MGYSAGGSDAVTEVMPAVRQVQDEPTRLIPVQRRPLEATTVIQQILDAGWDKGPDSSDNDVVRIPKLSTRGRRRVRMSAKRRMQIAAKQYGKTYYVPRRTMRYWFGLWLSTALLFGSGLFFFYIWICNMLGLI